jgi:hypothetical protein
MKNVNSECSLCWYDNLSQSYDELNLYFRWREHEVPPVWMQMSPRCCSWFALFVATHILSLWPVDIVAYRPVAKQRLCKERPFLGNARKVHTHNRRTGLCNPFLNNGSVSTPTLIGYCWKRYFLFGLWVVAIRKSSIENRQSSSGVPSEQLV